MEYIVKDRKENVKRLSSKMRGGIRNFEL